MLLTTVIPFHVGLYDPNQAVMDANLGITGYTIEDFEDDVLVPELAITLVDDAPPFFDDPFGPLTTLTDPRLRNSLQDTWDGNFNFNNLTADGFFNRTVFDLPPNTVSFGAGLGGFDRRDITTPGRDYRVWVDGDVVLESIASLAEFSRAGFRNLYLRFDAEPGGTLQQVAFQQWENTDLVIDSVHFDHVAVFTRPDVTLSVSPSTINEMGGVAVVTATLSHVFDEDVTVSLLTGGNAGPTDYALSSSQIVIPAGSMSGSVDLSALDDEIDELDEAVVVEVIAVFNGSELGVQQKVVTIVDNDAPPTVDLMVDKGSVAEAGGSATFTATLSAPSSQPVIVDLGISGTASAADYAISGTRMIIAPGVISEAITVSAVDDVLDEPDETIVTEILAVSNGVENGVQQSLTTILDNDDPPTISLSVDRTDIAEAGGTALLSAVLSAPSGQLVSIVLGFGGTADAADYSVSATEISVVPGTTIGSTVVTAIDDEIDEDHEVLVAEIVSAENAIELEPQSQVITILDDDDPPPLQVTTMEPTPSGVVVEFSSPLDTSELNIYDAGSQSMGLPDITLIGATTGEVAGSLVLDPTRRILTFARTGAPLTPDTYTVMLRSAEDGYKSETGQLLDGNGDGIAGDPYVASFTLQPAEPGAVTVGIPDFVRGPGQPVHLPANTTDGIPLVISNGDNVRAVDLRIAYDPALLEITGAAVAAGMPPGTTVVVNTTMPGLLILLLFSTTSLPPGPSTIAYLEASVPAANAGEIYGHAQVLDLHEVTISDGDDNERPVIVDDAIHLSSFFGDVSGNGRINAADAAQVARVAALLDSGFTSNLLVDPKVVGDISANNRLNAADASLVARFAALIDVPQIPPIPAGVVVAGGRTTNAAKDSSGRGPMEWTPRNASGDGRKHSENPRAKEAASLLDNVISNLDDVNSDGSFIDRWDWDELFGVFASGPLSNTLDG